MPTYNCARFIQESIRSIVDQTYPNWELIIVNDGSTDGTADILKNLNDDRIRVFNNAKNSGIAESRNIAIQKATGKYLAWLDSDDLASPDRLEKQVAYMEEHLDCGLCGGAFVVIDAAGRIIEGVNRVNPHLPLAWSLLWSNPIAQSSVMLRKSVIVENAITYCSRHTPAEDYNIWCRLATIARMQKLDDVVLKYRSLESSAYHTNQEKAMNMSIESNEALVSNIAGTCPSFHRYLTVFAWVLPDRHSHTDLASIVEWCELLKVKFCNRFLPSKTEIKAIERDIYTMLLYKTNENMELFGGMANKCAALSYSFSLFSMLAMKKARRDIARVARSTAKKILRPFFKQL
jgi:glycosyltransferase involved in cell wall biosynthesis